MVAATPKEEAQSRRDGPIVVWPEVTGTAPPHKNRPRVSTASIVLVLVLVIDSLDRLANAIPIDAWFSCSRCFTLSEPMAVKIENENDHENEHDWRGQTLAKSSGHKAPKHAFLAPFNP
jgi:hypothetical protein